MSDEPEMGKLRDDWELLARKDAMWAVLTDGSRRWTADEFFATGRHQIDDTMRRVAFLAPDLEKGSAVDFGCGVGRLTQPLCSYFDRVVGVDIAPTMIEQANQFNQQGDRCVFMVNDRTDLALIPDSTQDFVNSYIVLQHIPKAGIRAFLSEFGRVLRPGGVAMFTLPSHPAYTVRGAAYRVVPSPAIKAYSRRKNGWVMQMNAIRRSEVLDLCSDARLRPLSVDRSDSAGRHWITYTYVMRKA
jgi:SAM-dependent methyltransferase